MGFLSSLGSIAKSIAGPLIGGVLGAKGAKQSADVSREINAQNIAFQRETNAQNIALTRELRAQDEALQREFAQAGVTWRVQDAKAAGLHPVYALGGAGATYSPSSVAFGNQAPQNTTVPDQEGQALANMGQNLSRAIQAIETPSQKQARKANLRLLEAQAEKEEAQATYWRSEAARNEQAANSAKSFPLPGHGERATMFGQATELAPSWDNATAKPDQVVSQRWNSPHVGAGTHPFWREYQLDGKRKIILPFNEEGPSEAIQSMPLSMWPYVIGVNREMYGNNWDIGFLEKLAPGLTNQVGNVLVNPKVLKGGM